MRDIEVVEIYYVLINNIVDLESEQLNGIRNSLFDKLNNIREVIYD